jgi:hypothetical protein
VARKRSRTPNRQATRRPDAGPRAPSTPAAQPADLSSTADAAQIDVVRIDAVQIDAPQVEPEEIPVSPIQPEAVESVQAESVQAELVQVRPERGDPAAEQDAPSLDPDVLLASLVEHAVAAVSVATGPLDAEWVLCRLLAMIEVDAPEGVTDQQRAQLRAGLLADLIDGAERLASADALALLRVCERYGPTATRAKATSAAARLSASGVAEPEWADRIGRPQPAGIWWYGDAAGRQESVGLLFSYPDQPHVISVLVDHELGGGIRDCWSADGPDAAGLRERTAEVIAAEPGASFRDLEPDAAAELLTEALALPVCAPAPHVEDVAICVELLRSRLEVLAASTA